MNTPIKQLDKITVPSEKNELITKALNNINSNVEIMTLWKVINVNAVDRLGMTDHGIVHFQIVSNIALKIARSLQKANVEMSIPRDYGLSYMHSELVVLLASLFHDLGISINRSGHEEYSLIIARDILKDVLNFLPVEEKTIVMSETLHAIISHRQGGTPYTIEAAIVRVADALDLTSGRSRIPYQAGKIDIHSVSATAIDKVEITYDDKYPIVLNITMNNSAGIFQIDELLKEKIKGSGIEKYIIVKASVSGELEKKLLKEFEITFGS